MTLAQCRAEIDKTKAAIERREASKGRASKAGFKVVVRQHEKALERLRAQLKEQRKRCELLRQAQGGKLKARPLLGRREWWKKNDPYLTVKPTAENAGRLTGYYKGRLAMKGLPKGAKDYFTARHAAASKLVAPVTGTGVRKRPSEATLKAAAELRRKAAVASTRKDYASRVRLLQQAEQLEYKDAAKEGGIDTPSAQAPWDTTAPDRYVAAKEGVPEAAMTRSKEPGEDPEGVVEEEATTEATSEAATSTPWYKKWWVWLLVGGAAAGGAYALKAGGKGGGGSIRILKMGGGMSFKRKAASSSAA